MRIIIGLLPRKIPLYLVISDHENDDAFLTNIMKRNEINLEASEIY